MTGLLDISLRLGIWFLLTGNLSPGNILIGLIVALLIPRRPVPPYVLRDGLRVFKEILLAIPQAYIEAWQMILQPHTRTWIERQEFSSQRSRGLIFLDIFLITFTPKTIVLKYHEEGWYEVHYLGPKEEK
ncbi:MULTISPECIES: Na+/H+ antiporter subunit E [unclassified Synechocystis]|uniref:Na+/H+ antiporter subunit E n=1 Tax=unclassified Synechocystis TaxID=2640012 RepID=UPI0003FEAA89|nr:MULTISPECIES: Na+/H+ antiporter subunit E [unclassified Synechocystis]AIE73799.1 Putative Multisubunit sodium/proton antiporter, MrpE subunit [Synechocystis sp. PCC 6714]MCT0252379.1 Na+/H+ antiporter subunit E [Synechocystis sp. CS-94]